MRKSVIAASVIAVGLSGGMVATAQAHHAVNAQFDVTKSMTIKGEFMKVDWQNPHAWFHWDVYEIDGEPITEREHWATETVGPGGLRRMGLSDRRVFQVGETYIVDLNPDRSGAHLGFTNSITFPDGRVVGIGYVDEFGNAVVPPQN